MSSSVSVKKLFLGDVIVSYDCPACGERLRSKRDAVGTPSRCSSCDAKLWVPGVIEAEKFDREHAKTNAARRRKWQGFRAVLSKLILVVLSLLAFRLLIFAFRLLLRYTGEPPSRAPWIQTIGAIALGIVGLAVGAVWLGVLMLLKGESRIKGFAVSFFALGILVPLMLDMGGSYSSDSRPREKSYEEKWDLLQESREADRELMEKNFKKLDVMLNEDAIKDYERRKNGK